MKMPIKRYQFLWLFCLFNSYVIAQDPLNAALEFSNLSRNPALAGIAISDLQFNFSYKNQDQSILLPYKKVQTQILSRYRIGETEDGFTAGALIRYEEAGENKLKRAQFLPVLNFHQSLSDIKISYLSLAFMASIVKTQFDPNNLPYTNKFKIIPFNPASPIPQILNSNSSTYFDYSTGMSYYSELNNQYSFYLGAALYHFGQNIIKQFQTIPAIQREWVINSGLQYCENNYSIQFMGDLRIHASDIKLYTALILGIPLNKNLLNQQFELNMGAYYNSNQELSPIISFKWPSIILSMSYDIYTGTRKEITVFNNAIECNVSLDINCHKRKNESEKMRCTKFR
ncbi:MAG: hypothetical protein WCH78_06110 [Bacteroidota bacterium]